MYNNGMKTCVLISTAGSLLNHNYGPFIDGHDVVIRTGQSPIRGYESHVGSKTTYRIMSVSLFDPHYNIDIHNFVKTYCVMKLSYTHMVTRYLDVEWAGSTLSIK